MPIYWFALLIAVLMSAASNNERYLIARPLVVAFGLVMIWGLVSKTLALIQAKRVLRQQCHRHQAASRLASQLSALRWLWLPIGGVALTACGLSQYIEPTWIGQSMALTAGALLLPSVTAIATTWIAERQFIEWAASADTDDAAKTEPITVAIWHSFRMQAAWIIAPVFLVLSIIDVASLALASIELQHDWIAGAIGLISLPFMLPGLIVAMWSTTRCDRDEETAWLCGLVRRAGFSSFRVRRWNTNERICTAMVAGFIPGFRVLLISDALLKRLDRKQITMVILHELAHVARWHIAIRILVLVPTWGVAGWISVQFASTPIQKALCVGAGLATTMLALRWVSHATELDADRYACVLADRIETSSCPADTNDDTPSPNQDAAYVLAQALISVCADNPKSSRSTWMHPSLSSRVRRLCDLSSLQPS